NPKSIEDLKQDPVWKAPGMQEYDRVWPVLPNLRGSFIRASTGSGDPEVPELPSARGHILTSELNQSSTFGAPVFDHRSCPFSPSMSDSP
ncbi:hypothetical protein AVEN_158018-2-1, partial [Araneus ventricosus]